MSGPDLALSISLGIGLAAATGLRIFLPMLVASVAAYTGHLHLNDSFAWLGSLPAMTTLGVAATAELLAYYIPVVDNLLDAIATPLAVVAGTVLAAAVMTDLSPVVKWSTAIIAGGGVAGLTQGFTTLIRAKSTVMTGGVGNSLVATTEASGAILISTLALIAPFVALAAILIIGWLVVRTMRRWSRQS
jgi:uncharacterized membrane protein